MPVHVELDHEGAHRLRRLGVLGGSLTGGLLLVVSRVAAIVAGPMSLAMIFIVGGTISGEEWPGDLPPRSAFVLIWVVSSGIVLACGWLGHRLVRGNRRLVLFLRRFRYTDATRAATFAAVRTVGSRWRLVTLDDLATAPVGVPLAARRLFRVGRSAGASAGRIGNLLERVALPGFGVTAFGALVSGGALLVRGEDPFQLLDAVNLMRPGDWMAFDLHALFFGLIVVAIVLAAGSALLLAGCLVGLVALPFSVGFASTADAVAKAEGARTAAIARLADLPPRVDELADLTRQTFSPRLVVVRVSDVAESLDGVPHDLWRATVLAFAGVASAVLLDVSELSENLLWEISQLDAKFGERCIVVGHADRVRALTVAPTDPATLEARTAQLLDGTTVLAYTTDRAGMRRFARALRNRLEDGRDQGARARTASPAPA